MTKISKVIFVQKEQTVTTEDLRFKIESPKEIGKIELPKPKVFPKKEVPSNQNLKPKFWENFPAADWSFYLDFAKKANKKIGKPASITLSKKARVNGELNEEYGSIWYACSSYDFKNYFRKPLAIATETVGMKRLSLADVKKMDISSKFSILWVGYNLETELIECIKLSGKENSGAIFYKSIFSEEKYKLSCSIISEEGFGVLDDEEFYFFNSSENKKG